MGIRQDESEIQFRYNQLILLRWAEPLPGFWRHYCNKRYPMEEIRYPRKKTLTLLERTLIALLGGFLAGFALFIALVIGSQILFSGKIITGTVVVGIPVGGKTPQEAAAILNQRLDYPINGKVLIRDGERSWILTPGQLGMFIDPEATAAQAFAVGRTGSLTERIVDQAATIRFGTEISPDFVFDQRVAYMQLQQIAFAIDKPVVEADLSVNGSEVIVRNGEPGRHLDIDATLVKISALLPTLKDGVIDVEFEEIQPYILNIEDQANIARTIISSPLLLTAENAEGSPWEIDTNTLAENLHINRILSEGNSRYEVGIDSAFIRKILIDLAPALKLTPEDAHYIFNDSTRELEVIKPAVIGRELNIEATISAIQEKITSAESHQVDLVFDIQKPFLTDEVKGSDLGITELVHEEVSYFYGSSADRVQNIIISAGKFHGVMVAPGETFSMADTLGAISLENGYAEALIIAGGQTIQGVGGGICQVSTTLFRTAFFAGFPIVERYPHAYRVSYYEKVAGNKIDSRLAGLDASVFVPIVDFKFTNDTEYWLLMETYVNPTYSSIVWKFYSTKDGREVSWNTTGLTNIVPAPEPKYIENPKLSTGEIKQIDWAVDGADVTVNRTVTRNGEVIDTVTIFTRYIPWQAVFEYGPGTEIPKPND
jgi:vancomycin resistance protein YoaR